MTQAQLTKNWTISPNVRRSFISLNNLGGWWLFKNHTFLVGLGWAVKFTCDGTTGPTGAGDTTNRLTTEAACVTRGASAAAAQSYTVLQNVDGVQLLIAYQGATDDILKVAYSPGGLYALATPSTNQPTASDEVAVSALTSVLSATASADRVMTIWGSNDTRHWSNCLFRQNSVLQVMGVEPIVSLCATGVFTIPYVGYRYPSLVRTASFSTFAPDYSVTTTGIGTAGWNGCAARIFTAAASRLTRCGGGDIDLAGAADTFTRTNATPTFASDFPALQGGLGSVLLPLLWQGEKTANLDGFLGYPIDWWMSYTSSVNTPSLGNFLPGYDPSDNPAILANRANWFVCLGSAMVRPWRNAAATLETQ